MFLKSYYLGKSEIHGIGIFANEDIKEGEIIWTPSKEFTYHFDEKQLISLPKSDQDMVRHYGYFHKDLRVWHFSAEDSRYINHSKNPTVKRTVVGDGIFAIRDIQIGEELTQDYEDFEELRSILKE